MNDEINFTGLFERFGGFKQFVKVIGANEHDVRLWISNGYIPKKWRNPIRVAVSNDIIKGISK